MNNNNNNNNYTTRDGKKETRTHTHTSRPTHMAYIAGMYKRFTTNICCSGDASPLESLPHHVAVVVIPPPCLHHTYIYIYIHIIYLQKFSMGMCVRVLRVFNNIIILFYII